MKTAIETGAKVGSNHILSYKVRKMLVGLEMDSIDDAVLKYLHHFAAHIPVHAVQFIHVVPKPDIFNLFEEEEIESFHLPIDPDLESRVARKVHSTFSGSENETRIKIELREGNPLEQLLDSAEEQKADLVVIGQKADIRHHGITAKNFARQVWSNALLIPQKVKPGLRRILVPVDFSNHSAEALRTAIAINKCLQKPAEITALHLYNLPGAFSVYRFNRLKIKELTEADRKNAMADFIREHVPEKYRASLKTVVMDHDHLRIGEHLTAFAQKNKSDLIVMGAKGHSKVALLLLGSVTEHVLSLSKQIPVLLVK
jgi:nucleotide-binding universal stress UspA family protein